MEHAINFNPQKPNPAKLANIKLRAVALLMRHLHDAAEGTPLYGKKGRNLIRKVADHFQPAVDKVYKIKGIQEEDEKTFYFIENLMEDFVHFIIHNESIEQQTAKLEAIYTLIHSFEPIQSNQHG